MFCATFAGGEIAHLLLVILYHRKRDILDRFPLKENLGKLDIDFNRVSEEDSYHFGRLWVVERRP